MSATDSTALPVLVVGATGSLGGKVVDELLGRGKNVRALVRPASDASRLESRGVEIARGDMLDVDSLVAAMNGADAVITTAAGYTRGGKNANDIDTIGNANLAEAAHRTGIRRFVLTSILTSDQTPQVPHFWHKKLAEDKLEQLGVPFVALRPGAFLDQVASRAGDPVDKGRMWWIGMATVPLAFVHTSDLAAYLATAVDAEAGERIDIGGDRPVSMREVADVMGSRAGKKIKVWAVPSAAARAAGAVAGPFMPLIKDMAAMFSGVVAPVPAGSQRLRFQPVADRDATRPSHPAGERPAAGRGDGSLHHGLVLTVPAGAFATDAQQIKHTGCSRDGCRELIPFASCPSAPSPSRRHPRSPQLGSVPAHRAVCPGPHSGRGARTPGAAGTQGRTPASSPSANALRTRYVRDRYAIHV